MIVTDNTTVAFYINKQGDPFPHTVTSSSGSVYVASIPRHNSQGQARSRLSERDSRPPVTAKSANNNRVKPPPKNSKANLRHSDSGHVCHSPQHSSSPVYVSYSGASSTGDTCSVSKLAGEVDVHVSTTSPAKQIHSENQVHPGGRGNSNSPLVAVSVVVSTTGPPSHHSGRLLSEQGYVSDGKSYISTHGGSHITTKKQDFRKRSLGSRQLLEDP